jgi:Zn finger protein HypA/HybF involved in hydrogenase expression
MTIGIKADLKNGIWLDVQEDSVEAAIDVLAEATEAFGEKSCRLCGSNDLRWCHRQSRDGDEFREIRCNQCGGQLDLTKTKKDRGGKIYPRRKDKEGNWIGDYGWYKWSERGK